ncbi:MAG: threonine ammonia-lyase [Pseudomonadota bacterium]
MNAPAKDAKSPADDMSEASLSVEDVRAAAAAIDEQVERTPMRRSRTLSAITGADVWVKFENLQFTASFKERGALNKLLSLSDEEKRAGVVAMSAGNHAQGVAYHAARLGVPATIVMPEGTPFVKIEHTRNHGARVVIHGEALVDADAYARKLEAEQGLTFIHPYDDPKVVAGQGSIALEMLEDAPDLDVLIVPVGGGGLISGMATAAKAINPRIQMIGVEPRMYPSLTAELAGREPKVGGATIAEGIAVKRVGRLPAKICANLVDDVLLVDEDHMERAITLYATVEKTVAEGAGAAGLAALLAQPSRFQGRRVGLVLCGGNIDTRLLASVLTRSLVREKRITSVRIVGGDNPGLLAEVAKIIGDGGANIIEVAHNRIALDVPAKGAEFDILIETRDAQHTQEIVDALAAAGFPPRMT